jgi:pimeloyl-ACP methyl ester carboxylesterase
MKTGNMNRRDALKLLAVGTVLGTSQLQIAHPTRAAPLPVAPLKFVSRNGVKLAYTQTGKGRRDLLLVHGWGDDHGIMAAMSAYYAPRYRVTAIDLRGHGDSDKPKDGYAVSSLADDLDWMCQQLKLQKPIVVGHSLGGSVALELTRRHPTRSSAIVALEGVILPPQALLEGMKPFGEALRSPAWREAMQGFVESSFLPTDDPNLKKATLKSLERIPQHVHIGVYDGSVNWDAAAAARGCKVPFLYVEAGSGLSDLEMLRKLVPQLMIGKTVGVGHNQLVATPQQAVAMMDRFIAINK